MEELWGIVGSNVDERGGGVTSVVGGAVGTGWAVGGPAMGAALSSEGES